MSVVINLDLPLASKVRKPTDIAWRQNDITFFENMKGLEKTKRVLENTQYNWNINIWVGDRPDKMSKTAAELSEMQVADPNAINVVFSNNVTTDYNWMAMTGWIMAHRLAHACMTSTKEIAQSYYHVDQTLSDGIDDILTSLYNVKRRKYSGVSPETPESMMFVNHLFTMRSARRRMIVNGLDPIAELMAQFIITGKIVFNRSADTCLANMDKDQFIESIGYQDCPKNIKSYYQGAVFRRLNSQASPEEVDVMIQRLEALLNAEMKILCDFLVGKKLRF